jgi:NDP-sugar pyrophosphorylase family protein
MRASGIDLPKPLVPIGGVSLLERNVCQLLRQDFRDIVVSVPDEDGEITNCVTTQLLPLAERSGATLTVLVDVERLGNIGCAGRLHGRADSLLVVYADNLTDLDLNEIVAQHEQSGSAMTLASHEEPFRLPYGRLLIQGDHVVGYEEKPVLEVTVCSAVTVLGPMATGMVPVDRPTGLVDLTRMLLQRGLPVGVFRHSARWVDVNHADDVRRAEHLVAADPNIFG